MKARLVKYAYFLVLIADIAVVLLDYKEFEKFLKPLLMPLLLYYLIEKASGKIYRHHLLLALGLIFAWIGDLLLLSNETVYLMGGIGAFFITQIIYLLIFKSNIDQSLSEALKKNKASTAVLFVCLLTFLGVVIGFVELPLLLLVVVYACAVTTATVISILQRKELPGYGFMSIGMICFLISDAMIGINLFITPLPVATLLIMSTYGIAQYLITEGISESAEYSL